MTLLKIYLNWQTVTNEIEMMYVICIRVMEGLAIEDLKTITTKKKLVYWIDICPDYNTIANKK